MTFQTTSIPDTVIPGQIKPARRRKQEVSFPVRHYPLSGIRVKKSQL